MDKNEYLNSWAEKLSMSVEYIKTEFDKVLEDEKTLHPDVPLEQQEMRALKRLSLMYKKQLRSPAVGFEGIIIGVADCVDIVAKQRKGAAELFRMDPQTAVGEGITDEEGNPLDSRPTWSTGKANPGFGKPLPEHNYLRNIFGIAVKSNTNDTPKLFTMLLSGTKAENEDMPVFKPLRFSAIDKSKDGDNKYQLNASQFTSFGVDNNLKLPVYDELLKTTLGITSVKELASYHDKNKDDFNRLVAVVGDVSMINSEPTSTGSRVMAIEDTETSLEDLESMGVTCWIPPRINIDFAEGSKVVVIGRTGQSNKKDDDGNITEELNDVTINTFGVYAIPEFKIDLPEDLKEIEEVEID